MSVKKDPSGRRYVEVEAEVPGTLEEVWEAIATGPGVSSWFVPTEEREDGSIVSHFGPGMDAVATKTAWEPPHRFAGEGEGFGPGAPPLATEWSVEARSGGTCVVRVVHSLFASTDDWDNQLEGIESGWPDYFRILRLYLTHFRGQHGRTLQFMNFVPKPVSEAWESLTASLGLTGAAIAERRHSPLGAPPLAGVVEHTGSEGHPFQLLVRLEDPTPGIAHFFALDVCEPGFVTVRLYLYGDHAASIAERDESQWQSWLERHLPSISPLSAQSRGHHAE